MGLNTNLSKNVEAFALDFVRLIRGVRVYPSRHPSLVGVAEGMMAAFPLDSTGHLTIGVTPTELVVGGEFVGGKAAGLASLLHARKVLRIFWTQDARLEDVWTFARLLSTPGLEGDELSRRLHSEGVYAIDLEPLELDQIHGEITDAVADLQANAEERRRRVWLSLMSHEMPADQVASAMTSEQFWVDARAAWAESGYGDSDGFTELLLKLGERFEAALSLMPERQRETVLDYLGEMGKSLSVRDLVRIVSREGQRPDTVGQGITSLLREIDGERFVDFLAGLTASGNQGTRRLAEVYRRFAPVTAPDELLSLVRARLSLGEDSGFAVQVWRTVEDFILKLMEDPFMDLEYSQSLEDVADSPTFVAAEEENPEGLEDPNESLDYVILGLAIEGEDYWCGKLLQRLESRTGQLGVIRVLGFIRHVDGAIPRLVDSNPLFVRNLFKKGLSSLSKTTATERQALITFTLMHEAVLLDTALKALTEEEKMSTRFFLVNLLSSFSSSAVPAFISKARNGPWYVTRNLAIVLGQQGFPQALPTLKALSNHPHPKVRREALKALRSTQSSISNSRQEDLCATGTTSPIAPGMGESNLLQGKLLHETG